MKHLNLTIRGKVQGVFFRVSTQEKADELGISGFVRNEPDGSVYIEAEGNEEMLQLFTAWCQQGPRFARVDEVIVVESDVSGFKGFVVNR